MAHAASDQPRQSERQADRRANDRRIEQTGFAGEDRREAERRSGRERRGS